MAVLSTSDILKIYRGLMRYWSSTGDEIMFLKADLYEAIEDLDAWIDQNASVINAALPSNFRTLATTEQKAVLLSAIVAMRYTEDWLTKLVGGVL